LRDYPGKRYDFETVTRSSPTVTAQNSASKRTIVALPRRNHICETEFTRPQRGKKTRLAWQLNIISMIARQATESLRHDAIRDLFHAIARDILACRRQQLAGA
jgi:hypothetical protein